VVLALMPVGVGFIMSLVNTAYLRPLFEEPVGRACVAGAVVMEIIGYFVIQRIVNIKF
jgi:tight adherence protein B